MVLIKQYVSIKFLLLVTSMLLSGWILCISTASAKSIICEINYWKSGEGIDTRELKEFIPKNSIHEYSTRLKTSVLGTGNKATNGSSFLNTSTNRVELKYHLLKEKVQVTYVYSESKGSVKIFGRINTDKMDGVNGSLARGKCNPNRPVVIHKPVTNTPTRSISSSTPQWLLSWADESICQRAVIERNGKKTWDGTSSYQKYVDEAKRRGLSCGVGETQIATVPPAKTCNDDPNLCTTAQLCSKASKYSGGKKVWVQRAWSQGHLSEYADEAKRRGLTCGVDSNSSSVSNSISKSLTSYSDLQLCYGATRTHKGIKSWDNRSTYSKSLITEAKRRGLSCGFSNQTAFANITNSGVCVGATYTSGGQKEWTKDYAKQKLVIEAKRRGLSCGVSTQTASISSSTPQWLLSWADESICQRAVIERNGKKTWDGTSSYQKYVDEAKRRGLSCGVGETQIATVPPAKTCNDDPNLCTTAQLCSKASKYSGGKKSWNTSHSVWKYVNQAKRLNLKCGVNTQIATVPPAKTCNDDPNLCTTAQLCSKASGYSDGKKSWNTSHSMRKYVDQAKRLNLKCGVENSNTSLDVLAKIFSSQIIWLIIIGFSVYFLFIRKSPSKRKERHNKTPNKPLNKTPNAPNKGSSKPLIDPWKSSNNSKVDLTSLNQEEKGVILGVRLGMSIAMVDGVLDSEESQVIKNWASKSTSDLSDSRRDKVKKLASISMKETHDELKQKNFAWSPSVISLNQMPKYIKYDVIELCYDVMAADGRAEHSEMQILYKLGDSLKLDLKELEKIRDIRMKEVELTLGLNPEWSKEEINNHLTNEFKKWNARITNLPTEKDRAYAENMLKLIGEARLKMNNKK